MSKRNLLLFFLLLLPLAAWSSYEESSRAAIEQRIKRVGEVVIQGTPSDQPAEIKPSVTNGLSVAKTGEEIFNAYCTACHLMGVAGAPKKGDKAAWAPRVGKGINSLIQSAIKGLNAMPPKGTCVECTDTDLKNAIEYMLKG